MAGLEQPVELRRRLFSALALTLLLLGSTATAADDDDDETDGPPLELIQIPIPVQIPRALPEEEELEGVQIAPSLRRLARELEDPTFAGREAATKALLDSPYDLRQLCALLSDPGTSAEQRYRLLMVVQQRLLAAPRGALGISMQPRQATMRDPGIEVIKLIAGLPAEQVLRVRDRITHIDGKPVSARRDLIILIQSKAPGEAVSLTVRRPQCDDEGLLVRNAKGALVFDTIEVTLELGDVEELRDPDTGAPQGVGLVDERRAEEAAEAVRRYAPRPHYVEVVGSGDLDFLGPPTVVTVPDAEVESHSIIQSVRLERALIDAGQLELTDERRALWNRQLQLLRDLAEEPGLPPRELEFRRRLAERYAELVRP